MGVPKGYGFENWVLQQHCSDWQEGTHSFWMSKICVKVEWMTLQVLFQEG
jgi:hypothetical protein